MSCLCQLCNEIGCRLHSCDVYSYCRVPISVYDSSQFCGSAIKSRQSRLSCNKIGCRLRRLPAHYRTTTKLATFGYQYWYPTLALHITAKKTKPIPRRGQGCVPLDPQLGWERALFSLSALGPPSWRPRTSDDAARVRCLNDISATWCWAFHKQRHVLVRHIFTQTDTIKILLLV